MDFVISGLVHFARQKVFWRSGKGPSFVPSRDKLSFVVVVCSNALHYSCFSGCQGVLCTSVTLSKRNLVNSVVCYCVEYGIVFLFLICWVDMHFKKLTSVGMVRFYKPVGLALFRGTVDYQRDCCCCILHVFPMAWHFLCIGACSVA